MTITASLPFVPLCRAAWLEYRVTRQHSTANGARYLTAETDPQLAYIDGAPFVAVHLGFAVGQGPNLERTCLDLDKTNRDHAKQLARREKVPNEVLAWFASLHGDPIRPKRQARSLGRRRHRSKKSKKLA